MLAELKIGTLEHRDAAALAAIAPRMHVLSGPRSAPMYSRTAHVLVEVAHATVTTVDGAGHLAPLDAAPALAAAIAARAAMP